MILKNINNSLFLYEENQTVHVIDYCEYIFSIIEYVLSNLNNPINVIFGSNNIEYNFPNKNKVYIVDVQYEHNLVRIGAGNIYEKIIGNVKYENDENYLVRIHNRQQYENCDIILEYSNANIENIRRSGTFKNYLNKCVYTPPILFDYNYNNNKTLHTISMLTRNQSQRRDKFLQDVENRKVFCKNIENFFGKEDIKNLYQDTKILVNIHQTDFHHTLEELRVLPALLNGVIVVSEDVPLKEVIPYSDYIIWAKYDEIIDKIIDIQNNYDFYFRKIFKNSELHNVLNTMQLNLINQLNTKFKE